MASPDPIFSEPRWAEIYDTFDGERDDLDHYIAMVGEFGATSVLDVGCGTGALAVRLAELGIEVVGVDPAAASLEVARSKRHANAVRWIHGDATALPPLTVDLAAMTGNVAQVFITDDGWSETLEALRERIRSDGRLVFETRNPERRAWEGWVARVPERMHIDGVGWVESSFELLDVALPLVSFRWVARFERDNAVLTSDSTLRFRSLDELAETLGSAGFGIDEVRDAPDRPGLEWVIVAS